MTDTTATPAGGASELTPLQRAIIEIRELRVRLATAERADEPIAIVGAGLRLPGGVTDLTTYWELLVEGRTAIGEVPRDRWDLDRLYDDDPDVPGRMATRYGGFLDDVAGFDAEFFGISPREAVQMDPQQRILLEVAWEALEHAGLPAAGLFGTDLGVYLGLTNSDYGRMLLADRDAIDTYTGTGSFGSVAAGRLSYVLGATGPALTVDTACSSSLVAVHLAAEALRRGECSAALAGGVGLILSPELTVNFSRARMMAPDGRCKTFDAAADGYVRSEGCGLVVLKRMSDAVAAGDTVHAVVLGSAVNQDGRSGGLTAPNGPSQERVITAAVAQAGIDPTEIGYVEAHGTGTALGDPIEVGALGRALCRGRAPDAPLLLGSMKTNLGHLEAAAGIAGLLKVVLMLRHGVVPPHLHLDRLNPHIESLALPIDVPRVPTPWTPPGGTRLAGVSSFGISGTNAHVVLGAAPAPTTPAPAPVRGAHVISWSARDASGLRGLADRYATLIERRPDIAWADIAAGVNRGRGRLAVGASLVAPDGPTAARHLAAYAAGGDSDVIADLTPTGSPPDVTFLFTGHGSNVAGMGAALYADEPVFRAALDRCDALLAGHLDRGLTDVLFGDGELLGSMRYAQPALFALQYALVELWRAWGVRPDAVAGHSAGEYVAAVVAGVLSLEDGLHLIATRGRLMSTLPADGAMTALFVDEASVAAELDGHPDLDIAAVNGPATTVVSGARPEIDALIGRLGLDTDDYRHLDVSVAAHSHQIEPILDEFERAVSGVSLHPPQIELVSSMTGAIVSAEITEPGYWRQHLRAAVRFADVFATLAERGRRTFLEIGPRPTLLGLGRRCWGGEQATWAASLHGDTDAEHAVLTGLATLAAAGVAVDWAAVDGGRPRPQVEVPTYPWHHEHYWADTAATADTVEMWPVAVAAAERAAASGPLDLAIDTYPARWELLDRLALGYIADAVGQLGWFTEPGAELAVSELVDRGAVPAGYRHLAERWLGHLADAQVIERRGDRFAAPNGLDAPDRTGLAAAEAATDTAGIEPLLEYVHRCGRRLAAVLAGDESPLATLFPDGGYATVDFLYHHWAVARYVNGIAREALAAAAATGRPLRIVEIGAGTGGTTAAVLPALPPERSHYTFTDVSDFFLARAQERFADYPFVRYTLLDIERPPADQDVTPGGYDVVVASNVLHATANLDTTLAHVRQLLAPGGLLIAYEATRHPRWFDITTGLIEGWQRFEDEWRGDHPLLDPDRWQAALTAAGFEHATALPTPALPTRVLGQHLLLARAPGAAWRRHERQFGDVAEAGASTAAAGATAGLPTRADIDAAVAAALPDERHDVYVGVVRAAIARVLRMPDAEHLPRERPLSELGLDSLMAVELRNVLQTCLAVPRKLPATLIFDHPNVAALARYVETLVAPEQAATGRAEDAPTSAPAAPALPSTTAAELAGLSDDEVEAMLMERLGDHPPGTTP